MFIFQTYFRRLEQITDADAYDRRAPVATPGNGVATASG